MPMPDPAPLLACPACAGPLTRLAAAWDCPSCPRRYPDRGGLPWLFAEPEAVAAEWGERLHFLLQHEEREATRTRAELAGPGLRPATLARLTAEAAAHADHAQRLTALLAPLALPGAATRLETRLALGTQLPASQGLSSYYANVHRDWCWGEAENAATLACVQAALGDRPATRIAVLGSGAGRLAYDLHQALAPAATVALDFNPLLALVAARVCAGERLELREFPIAPRDPLDAGPLRLLAAPAPARPGLSFVVGDALRAPLAAGAFDVVLTPWFVDIAPDDLADLMRRVNRLLAPGGRWINHGSLAFTERPAAQCYGWAEVEALLPEAGFTLAGRDERPLPYMQSPASRHARVELVLTFAADKQREVPAPAPARRPAWLESDHLPVPVLPALREQALATRVYAFMMAMVDGRRTLADMARLMEEQRLMPASEAREALRGFFQRMLDEAARRARF